MREEIEQLAINEDVDILVFSHNCIKKSIPGLLQEFHKAYPKLREADKSNASSYDMKLGHYTYTEVTLESGKEIILVNAYIQFFPTKVTETNGSLKLKYQSPIHYDSIYNVFKLLSKKFEGKVIGVTPFVGANRVVAKTLIDAAVEGRCPIKWINFFKTKINRADD